MHQVWYNNFNNEIYIYGTYMHKSLIAYLLDNPSRLLEWIYLGDL